MARQFASTVLLLLTALHAGASTPVTTETVYPEVIPGPGLPSLAELNLTSAELYERPLDFSLLDGAFSSEADTLTLGRRAIACGPDGAYTHVNGLIACYNFLRSLGTQRCSGFSAVEVCLSGSAHVVLRARNPEVGAASYCVDVSLAVLQVINDCTRPAQDCAGRHTANGNGDLMVHSTHVNFW